MSSVEKSCINCGSKNVKISYYQIPIGFGLAISHEVTDCKDCGYEEDFEMS